MERNGDTGPLTAGSASTQALELLVEHQPQRHDLVIGFVGAIGTVWEPILRMFENSLRRFDYLTKTIHVVGLLDDLEYQPLGSLPGRDASEYYEKRMNAGDRFRRDTKSGASMGALAVREIVARRRTRAENAEPIAYLLRSLKHPDEVRLLRHVYGEAFSLVGVASSASERRQALSDRFSLFDDDISLRAEPLIARDKSDSSNREFGQNVRDTYSVADVFVAGGGDVEEEVDRYVDSIFGAPFLTPTRAEEGMRFAQDAALRSAAQGRQVGAALIPTIGTPVVVGTNEVPRPGGGQYWEGDHPDHRDFREGQDPNQLYINGVVQELLERLAQHGWLAERLKDLSGPALLEQANRLDKNGSSMLGDTRASALIEFTRCLHAEQATIVNAARSGVSTQGATLYTTTFPCHECAKMIIGAGIVEVHYVEPYPKSLVARLYRHLIDTSPAVEAEPGLTLGKVTFHQFLGIAPCHYTRAFTAGERKTAYGLVAFDRQHACPRTSGWNATAVKEWESVTVASISRMIHLLADSREDPVQEENADLASQTEPSAKREARAKLESRS